MRKIVTFETIDGQIFENFKEAQNHENRLTKIQISVDDLIDKILEFDNSNLFVDEVDLENSYFKARSIIENFLKYNEGRKVWKKYSLIDNDGDVEEVIWKELVARIYVQKVMKLYKDLPYTKKEYLELVRYWQRELNNNLFEYIHKSILESLESLRILNKP